MLRQEGTAVPLCWPGGQFAGTGVFHETGEGFPNTYDKFFRRYNNGVALILPGSAIGGSLGVRAQVGGGEGHVETTLSPLLMRAAEDPLGNPWGITQADLAPGVFDLVLMDFQALYGKAGLDLAMQRYGTANVAPPAPPATPPPASSELEALRAEIVLLKAEREAWLASRFAIRAAAVKALAELPKTGGGNPARIGRQLAEKVLEG